MKLRLIVTIAIGIPALAADLSVGTATAPSGRRADGAITVAAGSDAAANVPVIVINGSRPGPSLALVAGAHGTEYASILALHRVAERIDPAALSGSVVILPLLNVASFA